MKNPVLDYKNNQCFICGTDHGEFETWDGPPCCMQCSSDLYIGGRKIKAMDLSRGNALVWLADGTLVECDNIRIARSLILEEYLERQRVGAAKKEMAMSSQADLCT